MRQVEAQVIDLLIGGELQLECLERLVFADGEGLLLFVDDLAPHIEHLGLGDEFLTGTTCIVHHLNALLQGVVLDMDGLASLLHTEVGRCRFEVVVVRTPHHAGPAGVTHPDEQSHTVLLRGFIHGTVAVVVEPLGQLREVACIAGFSEVACKGCVERLTALSTLQREVVLSPSITLRPELGGVEHTTQALEGRDIRHTAFGVEFLGLFVEIDGCRLHAVGAMTADTIVGRAGDVAQLRMELLDLLAQSGIDAGRGITFVAPYIDANAGMVADAGDVVG